MNRLRGVVTIVTGASSGFGWVIAKTLAAEGALVGLVARRRDRLEALQAEIEGAGGNALVCPADISSEQARISSCLPHARSHSKRICHSIPHEEGASSPLLRHR